MSGRFASYFASVGGNPRLGRWAVLLGLIHAAIFAGIFAFSDPQPLVISFDADEYVQLASYPLTHHIYSLDGIQPSAKREPGYSAFISAFMLAGIVKPHVLTAQNFWPVIVVQILMYAYVCWLVARATARLFGNVSGFLTLLLLQASPLLVYQFMIRNETLTMCLLGLLWCEIVTHWKERPSTGSILRAALWLSILCITKSMNVLFVPVLCVLAWFRLRVPMPKLALFFALSLLPSGLWMARNYQVFKMPIMGSIDGASSLYRGNILPYHQISSPKKSEMPAEARAALAKCATDADAYVWYKKAALDWMKANPVQYVKQCFYRLGVMFIKGYRERDIHWSVYPVHLLIGNYQLFVTLLVLGSLRALWRRHDFWIESAIVFFVFTVGLYAAVYGEQRYLHPAIFIMTPVYAFCLVHVLAPKLRSHRVKSDPQPHRMVPGGRSTV